MWLMTEKGFVSVVEHRDDPDTLIVRARVPEDLKGLGLEVSEFNKDADYRYRTYICRAYFAHIVMTAVMDLNYTNFKSACPDNRQEIYLSVWSTLIELEDLESPSQKTRASRRFYNGDARHGED